MRIPFEVVRHISGYVSQKDALECLLVCKSWYRPMFESLYHTVVIRTIRSFRAFLYVIAHHELTPGKFVIKLGLYIEDFNKRPVTFTEFELLTRYCVHLNVLLFSHSTYWRCMNELDLTNIWPHLRKLPIISSTISFDVCNRIKGRLEEVVIFAQQNESILTFMSSPCPKLFKVEIATGHMVLTTDTIKLLHNCAPIVREITLMGCMENISDTSIRAPLINNRNNHVQHLKCLVHHPDSAWFSIIKSTYHTLDTLTMVISNRPRRHSGYTSRPYTKFEIVRSIVELIRSTTIRQLDMDFKQVDDISFMQATTATLLYDHCKKLIKSMKVSVRASFICPGDSDCHHRLKSKFTTTKESPGGRQVVHHELEYQFIREFDEHDVDDDFNYELDLLEYTILDPINKLVAHLSLDIGMRNEFMWWPNNRYLHFDQILNYFTNLESLTVATLDTYEFDDELVFTVSAVASSKSYTNNDSLRCLTVQNISIGRCIFEFLFGTCTALSKLTLINCQIDKFTTLAVEYLCLESDVLLEIRQDFP